MMGKSRIHNIILYFLSLIIPTLDLLFKAVKIDYAVSLPLLVN